MNRASIRRTILLLLVLGLGVPKLGLLSGALASDEPAEKPSEEAAADEAAGEEGAESVETASALDELLTENPDTLFTIILLKFVPLGIGLILLVLWWLKRDKIRGGALPPPAPVTPTAPFSTGFAFLLLVLGMLLLPWVATVILAAISPGDTGASAEGPTKLPLWIQIAAMAIGSVPIAVFVLYRRKAAIGHPDADVAEAFEVEMPVATPAPKLGRAFGLGWWGFCVATAFVVPITMIWVLLLQHFGVGAELQELVKKVYGPGPDYIPLLIAGFGVLVAPLVEETLFRGLLYPALRQTFGGTRAGVWRAAVITSLIFAAIHGNLTALMPLFVLALVLTWIMETTNSLAACVFAHAIHNAFALIPLLVLRGF